MAHSKAASREGTSMMVMPPTGGAGGDRSATGHQDGIHILVQSANTKTPVLAAFPTVRW